MANKCVEKVKIGDSVEATIASTAYAVCSTASSTASKTAVIDGFVLMTGVTVHIKFSNSNTAKAPTLNVNSTGAKTIRVGLAGVGSTPETSWDAGSVISFTYDGTSWMMNDVMRGDAYDVFVDCPDFTNNDDAARLYLGDDWRIPTSSEFNELLTNTTSELIIKQGQRGILFRSNNNDNSVFFRLAGVGADGYSTSINTTGNYWCSDKFINGYNTSFSLSLSVNTNGEHLIQVIPYERSRGHCIRPVSMNNGIDLGLPSGLKWAPANLYASTENPLRSELSIGDYFAWGETEPKESYTWSTYKYGDGTTFTKYNSSDGLSTIQLPDENYVNAKAYFNNSTKLRKIVDTHGHTYYPHKDYGSGLSMSSSSSESYIPYGEYVVSNNYNPQKCFEVLLEYIESGKNIDLCGYTIGLHITSQVSLQGNFVMYNGYLNIESKEDVSTTPLFDIVESNIDINLNKVIIYDATHAVRLFACNGVNVGDIDINNCSFTNLRGILRIEECNVHSFKLLDSYINGVTLVVNQGVVFKNVNFATETILDGNTFKNCVCGFESSINDDTFTPTSTVPYILRNNYFDCGILENRDGSVITYHLAALIEGYKVICENNYIEQCVTYSYTTSETTAYDFYFSCREVYYNNNIINNIIGVAVDGARRVLTEVFKSKNVSRQYAYDGRNVKAKRVITNNIINLHPEEYEGIDLNTYNHNHLLILQTNEGKYYDEVRLENNVFNCQNTYVGHGYFGAVSFISSGNKYYFKGNTDGYGIYNLHSVDECEEFRVVNNEFRITENVEMYLLSFNHIIKNLIVRDNIFDGMNGCIIRYTNSTIKADTKVTEVCNIYNNKLYHTTTTFARQLDPVINANEVIFERSMYPLGGSWSSSNLFNIQPKSDDYKIEFRCKAVKQLSTETPYIRSLINADGYTFRITMSYESERHLDVITKTRMWVKQEGTNYYFSKDGINFTLVESNDKVSMDQLTSEMTAEETDNKVRMIVYSNGEFRLIQESGPTNLVNKSDLTVTIEVIE